MRFQIGGHVRVPIGFGELLERFAEKHADVVDEDVQAAAQFSGGVDEAQHFVAMRYVGFNGQRGAAKRLDFADQRLRFGARVAIAEGDIGAIGGEAESHAAADAARGAGYEGDAAVKSER